jgi:hypothetical protein
MRNEGRCRSFYYDEEHPFWSTAQYNAFLNALQPGGIFHTCKNLLLYKCYISLLRMFSPELLHVYVSGSLLSLSLSLSLNLQFLPQNSSIVSLLKFEFDPFIGSVVVCASSVAMCVAGTAISAKVGSGSLKDKMGLGLFPKVSSELFTPSRSMYWRIKVFSGTDSSVGGAAHLEVSEQAPRGHLHRR